jgi:uncharacterized protein (DUF433 family)
VIRRAKKSIRYTEPYPLEAAVAVCGPGRAEQVRALYALVARAGGKIWDCELKYGLLDLAVDLPGGDASDSWAELQRICTTIEAACEECGSPGTLRTDREYWRVLCDTHDSLVQLREAIATGMNQARAGDLIPGDDVVAKLRAKSLERRTSELLSVGELPVDVDPEVSGGLPVFRGTRVPIDTLLAYVDAGKSVDEYLLDYDVDRWMVDALLAQPRDLARSLTRPYVVSYQRLLRVWSLTWVEAGQMFDAEPEEVATWLDRGVPADRSAAITDLAAATDVLARKIKAQLIPTVVRRSASSLGSRSLLEMACAGEHAAVRQSVVEMLDLRRVDGG